jgi:hypothetical protein
MILIFSGKKQKLVRRAIANTILMCTTNQNGKNSFNHKAANLIGLTFHDLEILNSVLPKPKKLSKHVDKEIIKMEVKHE